jgi:DNA-binding response OmpR family regulator
MGAVAVLAVSPAEEDHTLLARVLEPPEWAGGPPRTCHEASEALQDGEVAVVFCATRLPDGTWRDVQFALAGASIPPRLIVTSRLADESLWADVLDRGGYDVLATPFDPAEVVRVARLAWWQRAAAAAVGT